MTQLNRGLKFDSRTSSSGATLPSVASIDNAAATGANFLDSASGAAIFTLTPASRTTASSVLLMEGHYLDLGLEYDGAGLVRLYAITNGGVVYSSWFAENTEHTIGISYQTPQNLNTTSVVISIDGVTKKEVGVSLSADIDGSDNRLIMPNGNFDGLLSQVAVFRDALTDNEIRNMTGDAQYLVNLLSKLSPSATVSGVTNTPAIMDLTSSVKILFGGSYNVGDVIGVSYKGISASYVVASVDKPNGATEATVRTNVKNKVLQAMQAKFTDQAFSVQDATVTGGPPSIEFSDAANSSSILPAVTFTNAQGFRESALDAYVNFSKTILSYETATGSSQRLKFVTDTAGDLISFYDSTTTQSAGSPRLTPQPTDSTLVAPPQPRSGLPVSGPFYAELANYTPPATSGAASSARYLVYIDPSYDTITPGVVKSMGLTIQIDPSQGTLLNLASVTPQSLSPVSNVLKVGNTATMQWLTQNATGFVDYKLPVAEINIQLPPVAAGVSPAPYVNLTLSDMSLDSKFFTTGSLQPLSTSELVQSQVFSVSGTIKQYTSDAAGANGGAKTFGPLGGAIKGASVVYQVFDDASKAPARLSLNMTGSGNKYPTTATPDAELNLSVTMQKSSAVAGVTGYSMTIELPSNTSAKAAFTQATGVTVTSTQLGRMLTLSGTFPATANADTDVLLGNLNLKLQGAYGKTESIGFSNVTWTIAGGSTVSTSGRDLSVGTVQTDSNGAYKIDNLPRGQLTTMILDTVDKAALQTSAGSPLITAEDALKALLMASGYKNGNNDWLPSDYIAADFNRDGVVTSEDALNILNAVANKPATNVVFFSKNANLLGMGKTNVSTPPLENAFTYQDLTANATQSTFVGLGDGPALDFVGVLIGDVEHP